MQKITVFFRRRVTVEGVQAMERGLFPAFIRIGLVNVPAKFEVRILFLRHEGVAKLKPPISRKGRP